MNILNLILILLLPFNGNTDPATITPDNEKPKKAAVSATHELEWTEDRRLLWDDFSGEADVSDPLHALTATNLDIRANCKDNNFNFIVRSVFIQNESWSKNKQSKNLLAHEQMHFDLTEVYARELRKRLHEIDDACLLASQDKLSPIISQVFDEWKEEQDRFDEECNHGLDREAQAHWAKEIKDRLAALSAYKTTDQTASL